MSILKSQGLIIKENNVGEADKIFTIITQKYGKIQASARGVRNPRSRLIAGTQYLCYSDFVFYKGKGIYRISQSEVIENFFELRNSIEKLSYASYLLELTSEVVEEGCPSNKLLKLLLNTLYMLSKEDKDPQLLKLIYELRLMVLIGYAPNMVSCTSCGELEDKMYFNSTAGGLLCSKCLEKLRGRNSFRLSDGALHAMRYILYCEMDRIFSFSISDAVLKELDSITQDFLVTHLGKEFNTLKYLKSILKSDLYGTYKV